MLAIGIDIGGTKMKAGIINKDSKCLHLIEIPTNVNAGKETILNDLIKMVEDLMKLVTEEVSVIGVGSAGRIDVRHGKVFFATPNLPDWTNTPLKALIEEYTKIPTIIDNDVNTALLAEMWIGAATGLDNVACITLGTGVGGAFYSEGNLLRGDKWSGGEVGHMLLYPEGISCNCGQNGCWEQYISGSALNREARMMNPLWSAKDLFSAASTGDQTAEQIVNRFVKDLAFGLVSIQNMIDPECIIIGGGLLSAEKYWWTELCETISQQTKHSILLKKAKLGNDAGMIGAARLGFDYLESKYLRERYDEK